MNKNIIFVVVSIVIICIIWVISSNVQPKEKVYQEELLGIDYNVDGNEVKLDYDTENPVVAMYIKNYGSVVMELYPDIAPNTVNNFISLVKSGFYDENSFHRLVPGFVLQGGDPSGNGTGGPGYNIKGEFSANGFENNLKHEKGVISMARSQDNDSAGSQFFICLEAASNLDGSYATFGRVIDGWDNIDKIVKNERVANSDSGKLAQNLTISKAIIDLKDKQYADVIKE